MARTFKGGPSDQTGTVDDMKNLKFSDSPARKKAVYNAYAKLMSGQTSGVEAERQGNLGEADPGTSILNVKSQRTMIKLNGGLPEGTLPAFDARPENTPVGGIMHIEKGVTKFDPDGSKAKSTLGRNERFPDAMWITDATGKKGGWFVRKETGMMRVE